jgi:hypothetical protein
VLPTSVPRSQMAVNAPVDGRVLGTWSAKTSQKFISQT